MSRISFLQDILSTVLDRRGSEPHVEDDRPLQELCEALLSARGEVSGNRLSHAILQRFREGSEEEKLEFFLWMLHSLDIDADRAAEAVASYSDDQSPETWQALVDATTPKRLELLRRINRIHDATGQLVGMRHDLSGLAREHRQLQRVDADFESLFKTWFNRGFLVLREIDWRTPANILEKIIRHEAVHAINDWQDLRRRLEPPDRKCFAFFHPAMQDEPLIFVEVALTEGLPESIQQVLHPEREPIEADTASVAVFYSISNCQPGLRGVSFGNFLIKHVATELANSFPKLSEFRTLSPLPSFAGWFSSTDSEDYSAACQSASALQESLLLAMADQDAQVKHEQEREEWDAAADSTEPNSDSGDDGDSDSQPDDEEQAVETATSEAIADLQVLRQTELAKLAAAYLVKEKRHDQQPFDPVARFHLGNGASLDAIIADGDMSEKGIRQSGGVMVSYLYDLNLVISQHEAYAGEQTIAYSKTVSRLLDEQEPQSRFRIPGVRRTG